ncbi:RagB/SusD family nutrient uptake outer membrane protein [Sunxiuqinia elliptica]|uniref:Putative outer membrane starch-binding protein n=1 Tax=Sunxiuqinia elliptica TaxID=655355 RepID=A0A4R6GNG4_9BACT|nr:RagB/SusD family nutrient uptake outer membrane protein [Sunxiuqinia elliptica]TDN96633.1 putative outer membrane starch-binding protein [Sunxiuqinia elliptica]TDO55808.1 putative outer membrane starch-binding protein [Sunxiuqinia elliptica]
MKKTKIFLTISFAFGLLFTACELTEDPKFLASDNLFSDVVGANTVLNGVYASLNDFSYYGADYHHLLNFASGMYNSNRDATLKDIGAMNPPANLNFVTNVWRVTFQTISRANNLLSGLSGVELADAAEQDNIMGQAYFLRSLSYFNLVRIYGKCPLIIEPVTSDNPYAAMADPNDIYTQIIKDAEMAEQLLPEKGSETLGRPAKTAANMLLAKVYMQLAGGQTAGQTDNWQKAYDEAIKVYGRHSLVSDFASLWQPETSNNTSESIFEVQGNIENTLRLFQLWTPSNGYAGRNSWGRFKSNLEVYDNHVNTYPNDPRIQYTFVTEWTKFLANGNTQIQKTYPDFTKRNNKDKSYPWNYKFFNKDINSDNYNTDQNFIVFRYADLLLMLAEIENELNGPENAYQYVDEVLARARVAGGASSDQPANWSEMDQEQFRERIMFEYNFELLNELHEYFNNRRRGYDWFKKHVIEAHNNHPGYDFSKPRDILYPDNPRIMVMPIPEDELSANPKMSGTDQNSGY